MPKHYGWPNQEWGVALTDIVERLRELIAKNNGYISERDAMTKAADEIERMREALEQANNYGRCCAQQYDALAERVSELEGALERIRDFCARDVCDGIAREALEKIKFRNLPGTTNHELAKEALIEPFYCCPTCHQFFDRDGPIASPKHPAKEALSRTSEGK
jgi:predicted nuclease with TOPRIM domain